MFAWHLCAEATVSQVIFKAICLASLMMISAPHSVPVSISISDELIDIRHSSHLDMDNATNSTRLRSKLRKRTRSNVSISEARLVAIAAKDNFFDDDRTASSTEPTLYIGVDLGTNSTAVEYHDIKWQYAYILTVGNFPGDENQDSAHRQTPTESAHPTHFA